MAEDLRHSFSLLPFSLAEDLLKKIKTSKLTYAVLSTASRRLLQRVLKASKQSVGELLGCIRAVNSLKMSDGESRHTASSEPFYDQSYCPVKHTSPIVVDILGRCVIAEEEGERDVKTSRPKKWKCTSECKLPTSMEVTCIKSLKDLFEKPVRKLREALNGIDSCSEHGHYTCPLVKIEEAYHELAGYPLPCSSVNAECNSSLTILRAAATHFPLLRRFVVLLYEAIRLHHQLDKIDTAVCAGDFSSLVQLCGLSDYKVLFKACSVEVLFKACSYM